MASLNFALLDSTRIPPGTFHRPDLERLAAFVLAAEKVRGPVELTLDMTGHKRIQELNRRFRGVDRTTDVISFRLDSSPPGGERRPTGVWGSGEGDNNMAMSSAPPHLPSGHPLPARGRGMQGDIAINVHQAAIQAKKMRHPVRREVRLLLIHGILHLLGYTDYTPVPRRRMFKRQNVLLRKWERNHS